MTLGNVVAFLFSVCFFGGGGGGHWFISLLPLIEDKCARINIIMFVGVWVCGGVRCGGVCVCLCGFVCVCVLIFLPLYASGRDQYVPISLPFLCISLRRIFIAEDKQHIDTEIRAR